jgi:beta-glucosidase
MNTNTLDWKTYSSLARTAVAEGCVLLRNENRTLPIRPKETVSVFGRIQLDYYKSGTGSGGMVNVPYVRSILDGLQAAPDVTVYEPLLETYRVWTGKHPFDGGVGWGNEPWCQEEMILTDEVVCDAAAHSDLALVIIGRTAGEDRDNHAGEGSFTLTAAEQDMLAKVCAAFSRTAVVLNVGNIIDMSWVETVQPGAVLYAWQGGMEGGMGVADVLTGAVSPSGKLADTIARDTWDYPSISNFGSDEVNFYQEDIYVGYRYFETFAPEKVLYPFGFGLSYTTFALTSELTETAETIQLLVSIENTGAVSGKEVVQVYCCPPQGLLGKPLRNLCRFAKTELLAPGESQAMILRVPKNELASYDDSGITGHRSCFVLEKGTYQIYVGSDVRSASLTGSFTLSETIVTGQLHEALAPVRPFQRLRPRATTAHDSCTVDAAAYPAYTADYEEVPLRTIDPAARIRARRENLPVLPCSGDLGYTLADVKNGTVSMETFLAQLSDEDLKHLTNGEGMCSPKVTAGTAAAFGGLTPALQHFGIPVGCCSDGPSGIRMDSGASAFSLPNGTLLACTFNTDLVTDLFEMEGLELYMNQIDTLLGPGINIHRCPLNGRNFEYHSEDPYLTGKMAVAQLSGLHRYPVTGTMKHFCGNNQEFGRSTSDSVISERALREIYLKPFEMGVKEGAGRSIMTTYGSVNGLWTAGSFDLNTTILRDEWGYDGIVMTDWWAKANEEGEAPALTARAAMVRAQNDLFMVTTDTTTDENDLTAALAAGRITREELLRNAANICRFLLASPAMERMLGTYRPVTQKNRPEAMSDLLQGNTEFYQVSEDTTIPMDTYETSNGCNILIPLSFDRDGLYQFTLTLVGDAPAQAQLPCTLSIDGTIKGTLFFRGGTAEPVSQSTEAVDIRGAVHYLKFYFPYGGARLEGLHIKRK